MKIGSRFGSDALHEKRAPSNRNTTSNSTPDLHTLTYTLRVPAGRRFCQGSSRSSGPVPGFAPSRRFLASVSKSILLDFLSPERTAEPTGLRSPPQAVLCRFRSRKAKAAKPKPSKPRPQCTVSLPSGLVLAMRARPDKLKPVVPKAMQSIRTKAPSPSPPFSGPSRVAA